MLSAWHFMSFKITVVIQLLEQKIFLIQEIVISALGST